MKALIIIIAQYFIVFSLLGVAAAFFLTPSKEKKHFFVKLVIGGVLAMAIAWLARKLYYDPRPFVAGNFTPYFHHAADNGFVSDHTLLSSYLGIFCILYKKWLGVLLVVLSVLIGASRVIAGVHHWTDILAAIIISLVAVAIVQFISGKIEKSDYNKA